MGPQVISRVEAGSLVSILIFSELVFLTSFACETAMPPSPRHWNICASIALATLLLFQSAGWFLTCGILQLEAKISAHIALNRRETPLQSVTLSRQELSKIRVGKKEIRYEGRLYDIKSRQAAGDSVALTLYHDTHEEAALDMLGSL
ncbi:MAG TPA: hypothetical protein PK228_06410, partial [Saprospiraceae bacterium]|nr:hypothetical protein [Saprospiraceae bacterium]